MYILRPQIRSPTFLILTLFGNSQTLVLNNEHVEQKSGVGLPTDKYCLDH